MSDIRCCALTLAGTRCTANAVAETDFWRCRRHVDWYDTASLDDRHKLAVLEIEELL